MKKWLIVAILLVVVAIGAGTLFTLIKNPASQTYSTPAVNITYSNIQTELPKTNVIQALPKDAVILINFYNFDSGEKVIEKSYILTNGGMIEGSRDSDLIISIHSKYLSELTNQNFCQVIEEAKANGDLGIETNLSSTQLAWKFKSMYSYRTCLGF